MLRDDGLRVSIDSMNVAEIAAAAKAGAELVLSVNATNRARGRRLGQRGRRRARRPADLGGLDDTINALTKAGVPSASTRSWSRSASASPRRWAGISKSAAAIPTPRCSWASAT